MLRLSLVVDAMAVIHHRLVITGHSWHSVGLSHGTVHRCMLCLFEQSSSRRTVNVWCTRRAAWLLVLMLVALPEVFQGVL